MLATVHAMRWSVLALAMVACGCRGPEPVSDTGYIGTWERIDGTPSKISLRRVGQGYEFNWSVEKKPRSVRCEGGGVCAEFLEGKKIYEWTFRAYQPDGSDELLLERVGRPLDESTTPLQEVDRLVVQPGGLELWAHTIERNHENVSGSAQPYRYRKLSDRPF